MNKRLGRKVGGKSRASKGGGKAGGEGVYVQYIDLPDIMLGFPVPRSMKDQTCCKYLYARTVQHVCINRGSRRNEVVLIVL